MKYSNIFSMIGMVAIHVACASDDGSSSNNDFTNAGGAGPNSTGPSQVPDEGAAKALAATQCYVGLKTTNVTYSGAGCSGTSKSSTVSAMGPNSWDDVRVTIDINLDSPPAIGRLGLASLTIQLPKDDGTMSSWTAPVDTCTATATGSATDDFMGWVYYSIDISCSEPATPTTDPSLAPLPLSRFTIVTFFRA